jgi:glycerol uptake facilitator-like aquaporin
MNISAVISEILGTMIFLLVILTISFRDTTISGLAPIMIGLGLAISVYIGIGLGGNAHFNPVVSAVMGVNGSVTAGEAFIHVICQFIGAGLAYGLFKLLPKTGSFEFTPNVAIKSV